MLAAYATASPHACLRDMIAKSLETKLEECKSLRQQDPDKAIRIAERSLKALTSEAATSSDILLRARFHYYTGNSYFYKRDLKASLRNFRKALTDAETCQDHLLIADIKIGIADVSRAWGNYLSAIELLGEARKLQLKHKSPTLAFTLHKLGICNHNLDKPEIALKYLEQANQHCEDYPNLKIHILSSMAIVCMDLGENLLDAKSCLDEALALSKSLGDKLGEANATCELGQLYGKLGKLKNAVKLCEASETMFVEAGFENYTAASNLYKGQIYCNPKFSGKSSIEAEVAYQRSLSISTENGHKDWVAKSHEHLANLYASTGREKLAIFHFKEFHRLQCEIQAREAESRMEYLSVLHELEEEKQKQEMERAKNAILEQSNRDLQALLLERKQLMGVAAHDLKNPISGIIGLADFLKNNPDAQAIEEIPAITELLELSAENALQIITNILEDHRLEEGRVKPNIRKTNLSKLCEEVCKLHKQKAVPKKISLQWVAPAEPVFAQFDRFSIKQALDNLVSNAVKFCSGEDQITVSITTQPEAGICQIHVTDTGPGITEKDQAKLFRRFAKLSNTPTGNESSSGLGLSIAKKLVDLNNGKLTFSSKPGKGTTFVIQLTAS